jgi:hypothetical protein
MILAITESKDSCCSFFEDSEDMMKILSHIDSFCKKPGEIFRCGDHQRPQSLARETIHPKANRWMMGKLGSRKHESASIPAST